MSTTPAVHTVEHPLVDFAGDGFVVSVTTASLVGVTDARANLLADCAVLGIRVVFVSPPHARMTFGMLQLIALGGAMWLVEEFDGSLRDAITGVSAATVAEAVKTARPGTTPARDIPLTVPGEHVQPWLQVALSVHHQARAEVLLGRAAEALAATLGDGRVVAWGTSEPAGLRFSRENLTRFARERMPLESRVHTVTRGLRPTTGTIRVARSASGVLEETTMLVSLGDDKAVVDDILSRLSQLFVSLANTQTVLFGSASMLRGRADLSFAPFEASSLEPVTLLLGPRTVRDLGLNVADLESRFGAIRAGKPRIPSLVLPLTPNACAAAGSATADEAAAAAVDGWDRFRELTTTVDTERLAKAVGLSFPATPSAESTDHTRPEVTTDAP
ncbi:MAG: DUF6177 family protein [Glaciihabitans sp.]